jgi:hypothetical protein
MRSIRFSLALLLLALLVQATAGFAQIQPTGRIVSIAVDQDPVRITYDLTGSADEEYVVILYLQRENDPRSIRKLEKVSGDVGEGRFSGSRRTIYWDRTEVPDAVGGARYQFALEFRNAGSGLPWYIYAGAAVVGGAVYLAVKQPPAPTPEAVAPASIPLPPGR